MLTWNHGFRVATRPPFAGTSRFPDIILARTPAVAFVSVITGSIARSAKRGYFIYTEADFEVFRPAGATRCTEGGL